MAPSLAPAGELVALVDTAAERMHVSADGRRLYDWRVSTGRSRDGFPTPRGTFNPVRLDERAYAAKFSMWIPYAVGFLEDPVNNTIYGIHGTSDLRSIGAPASHGCVRLPIRDAAVFFRLVQRYGFAHTLITVQ